MSKVTVLNHLDEDLLALGYTKMSLYNKNQLVVRIASKIDKDYTEVNDEDVLQYHRELKLGVLSDKCDEGICKGFESSNGHFYRTNRDDQLNMLSQKASLDILDPVEVLWETEDSGFISHTKDEWLRVFVESIEHRKAKSMHFSELKTRVKNATTHEELVSIEWDSK